MIGQKKSAHKVTSIRQPRVAPVVDLMAVLQASLDKSAREHSGTGANKAANS